MTVRAVSLVLLSALFALGPALAPALASTPEADARWAQGDHDEARRLYEAALAENPGDAHALFRSAQLHAWARLFDEALARWDRLLALDPGNDAARLERAKTLSWAGRQSEARAEYQALLAANPRNVDALVGVAQTHAWSGNLDDAEAAYERALAVDPDARTAWLGLAYLDVWEGKHARAQERIARVAALGPADRDLEELRRAEQNARAPWLRVAYDRLEDSDDIERDIFHVSWGRRFSQPLEIVVGAEQHAMEDRTRDADVTRLFAAAGWRPEGAWRFDARAGVDRSKNSSGDDRTAAVGTLAATWQVVPRWEATFAAARDTLIYSPQITDAEIEIDRLSASADGRFGDGRWRARGEVGAARFSDDNDRADAFAGVRRQWRVGRAGRVTIEAGPTLRFMDYADDFDNGYFDPQEFFAGLIEATARGEFAEGRWYFEAGAEGGWQSFTNGGVKTSGDSVFGGRLLVGRWVTQRLGIEGYAAYSDYAVQSATGFDFTQFGVRLRYRWVD